MELEIMLKALGEPMRLKIFQNLLLRKHCVRSLSRRLGISESAVSQHMKIMREAGLVYGEKHGYHTHYLPSDDAVVYLAGQFKAMAEASRTLDRSALECQCEYKRRDEK